MFFAAWSQQEFFNGKFKASYCKTSIQNLKVWKAFEIVFGNIFKRNGRFYKDMARWGQKGWNIVSCIHTNSFLLA
jgi:hypothetical protein